MADAQSETLSVPIQDDDRQSHVRRFSDSALMAGGDDAGSVSSSWAPSAPTSPGRSNNGNNHGGNTSFESTTRRSSSATSSSRRKRRAQGGAGRESSIRPRHSTEGRQASATTTAANNSKSFQDQFVAGTLDLLKMAGGATLSTTGKLVQPPLSVAQNVIIPALGSALVDYVNQVTPIRVKDWFRIVSTSFHHLITVIGSTAKGKLFRQQLHAVGDGLVDCVSSDASRQAIMDAMATWVKLSEALHTPETKVFLDQLSVLGCRLVDVAASGRNKQLLHDVSHAIWAGLELLADPSSTLAFAEVTAYLCFALEMEDAVHHHSYGQQEKDEFVSLMRQRAAQRRHQRNAYQKNTYTNVNMMQDANTTVEQVMLSSLGEAMDEAEDQRSFPSNVDLPPRAGRDGGGEDDDWLEGEAQEMDDGLNWRERAGDDIDLQLLQERITKRAAVLEEQREDQRRRQQPDVVDVLLRAQEEERQTHKNSGGTEQLGMETSSRDKGDIEEIVVTTVDESNDGDSECQEDKPQSAGTSVKSKATADGLEYQRDKEAQTDNDAVQEWLSETLTTDQPPVTAVNGESAYNRFYRRLDEIMDKKRTEAVVSVLNQQLDGQQSSTAGGLSWFPKAAAAAGAGNERGQDTIKNRVAAIKSAARSQIGVGQQLVAEVAQDKEARRTVSLLTLVSGLVGMFWFAMGFYGCYVMVFGPVFGGGSAARSPGAMAFGSAHEQEIIVRVVREVVHVDANGNTLNTERYRPVTADEDVDQMAACIANAMR